MTGPAIPLKGDLTHERFTVTYTRENQVVRTDDVDVSASVDLTFTPQNLTCCPSPISSPSYP